MNVYLYVHDNPINHIDPLGLGENDPQNEVAYKPAKADIQKWQAKLPESTCSIVRDDGRGSGEENARKAAEHEKWANHWKSYPVTGSAVRAGEELVNGQYGKAAIDVGNAFFEGWGVGGLVERSVGKAAISGFEKAFTAKSAKRLSVDEALGKAGDFVTSGKPIKSVDGKSGVQFIQTYTDEAGQTITKRVGFDLNPASPHVQKTGPHLNLQTQIDGVIQKTDPHIPIDPASVRAKDF